MERKTAALVGHRDCMTLGDDVVIETLERIIREGYCVFLNGGMGQFDYKCARCIRMLKSKYGDLQSILVIPYLSFRIEQPELFDEVIFPEELEGCHYKAAILKRNRFMVDHAELALCYVNYGWGGAVKTYAYAGRRKKRIINLGKMQ